MACRFSVGAACLNFFCQNKNMEARRQDRGTDLTADAAPPEWGRVEAFRRSSERGIGIGVYSYIVEEVARTLLHQPGRIPRV